MLALRLDSERLQASSQACLAWRTCDDDSRYICRALAAFEGGLDPNHACWQARRRISNLFNNAGKVKGLHCLVALPTGQ